MGRERRQVHALPPLRRLVHAHQAIQVRCPQCQTVTVGAFPAEAPSRAQYGPRLRALAVYLVEQQLVPDGRVGEPLSDLLGVSLSRGTLVTWVQQAATILAPVEAQLKTALVRAPVLHSDETGARQAGHLAWAHVACTTRLTHSAVHAKRGREATAAIGIRPADRGVHVHGGWAAYQANAGCRHALCNIHQLRELTFRHEPDQQGWAKALKHLPRQRKAATDRARQWGDACLPQPERAAFVTRSEAPLAADLVAHPAHPPPARGSPRRRGQIKPAPARHLLERLWRGRERVLAFRDDLAIPFDNKLYDSCGQRSR